MSIASEAGGARAIEKIYGAYQGLSRSTIGEGSLSVLG